MFNKENGELNIGTTIVSPSLTLDGFLLTLLSQSIIDKQTIRENIIFILNPQWVKESFFNVRLSFLSSTKSLFLIELRNSYDGLYPSWLFEDWSENDEKKIKGEHDFWLFQIFGKPHEFGFGLYPQVIYKFEWGEIESSCDPRYPLSIISIKYYGTKY